MTIQDVSRVSCRTLNMPLSNALANSAPAIPSTLATSVGDVTNASTLRPRDIATETPEFNSALKKRHESPCLVNLCGDTGAE